MENNYKLYSVLTKQIYDTEEELFAAENELKEKQQEEERKKEERKLRAKEVENAFKAAREAETEANKLLKEFCKDYGSFHTTLTKDSNPLDINNIFSRMFLL